MRADQQRLADVFVTDAANQGAAATIREGKDAQQILKAASLSVGTVVFLGVSVMKFAAGGDHHVLARFHINAGVGPELIAGDLQFLRDAAFGGRSLHAGRGCCWSLFV